MSEMKNKEKTQRALAALKVANLEESQKGPALEVADLEDGQNGPEEKVDNYAKYLTINK
jgi:hypothetical protein